jgi:hypothetical protein
MYAYLVVMYFSFLSIALNMICIIVLIHKWFSSMLIYIFHVDSATESTELEEGVSAQSLLGIRNPRSKVRKDFKL